MINPSSRRRGFTLLEVMVAVAILGLGLTAILSAQAGAFASANHGRNISVSVGLLRCKMTELEEKLSKPPGFQELDESDTGICCEGDDTPNMKCSWKIEKPQLPEAKFGDLNLDSLIGGSSGTAGGPGLGGAIGLLSGGAPGSTPALPAGGSVSDISKTLASANAGDPGALAGAAAGGVGGIASMVMSLVYPSLKVIFEASTRRITVTLTWREGAKSYNESLVQWVASPQKAGVVGDDPSAADGGTVLPTPPPTGKGRGG
ncbi:MAG: prepilin-type N-terminal cleavage/methylation domain-containing protein [Byssovorax sp.]